jgi:hypothetical protein
VASARSFSWFLVELEPVLLWFTGFEVRLTPEDFLVWRFALTAVRPWEVRCLEVLVPVEVFALLEILVPFAVFLRLMSGA